VALQYYLNRLNGNTATGSDLWRGFHCENSLLLTLFHLICWDSLFFVGTAVEEGPAPESHGASAPESVLLFSHYQVQPFELVYLPRCFAPPRLASADLVYQRPLSQLRRCRSLQLSTVLAELRGSKSGGSDRVSTAKVRGDRVRNYIRCKLRTAWSLSHTGGDSGGVLSVGACWSQYKLSQLEEVALAIGGEVLAAVFEALAFDYLQWSHGLPDLLLWRSGSTVEKKNGDASTAVFVEVKGPRDHLSHGQRAWIDRLRRAHAAVEVCHVSRDGDGEH
jgi:hypothetical protein